jgi:integrase/recombinase XerD
MLPFRFRKTTAKNYGFMTGVFMKWLKRAGIGLLDAKRRDLKAWIHHLQTKGKAPGTIRVYANAVAALYAWLVDSEILATTPAYRLETPKAAKPLPKFLEEAQVKAMIEAAADRDPDYGPFARRTQAIVATLYGGGLRASELVGLDVEDVDLKAYSVRIRDGKGGKERIAPIGEFASAAIEDWLAVRPTSQCRALFLGRDNRKRMVYATVWETIVRVGKQAGLSEHVWPHRLRHSCATHLLRHGAKLEDIQAILGHENLATTQLYAKTSMGQIFEAHRNCHPRG